ncbi:hypothetical protein [Edaphobacter modestus]|uniref:hypothetical protein n=1 Tax=Edaphobacter modestus TaxID=388466 RepID=UPI0013EE4772|nr:hypothetical protein [Edaphobacter modestus]
MERQKVTAVTRGRSILLPAVSRPRKKMQPLLDEVAEIKAVVVDLEDELKRLKKSKAATAKLDALVQMTFRISL